MKIVESKPLTAGPLMSWDIFMQGYRQAQHMADDKTTLEALSKNRQWHHGFNFTDHLFRRKDTIIVTSPTMHIVYASSRITEMTGYQPFEVIGKTPRLFQGEKTNTDERVFMRQAIIKKMPFESTLINYRKDGSFYVCSLRAFPVFNRSKQLVNFIAFEKEILEEAI